MTLSDSDKGGYQLAFCPGPLPEDAACEQAGGRLWLDALSPGTPRTSRPGPGPLARALAYARTATMPRLLLGAGTIRCWILKDTTTASYQPRTAVAVHIPVLDHEQWHDLITLARPLAARLARLPAEEVLRELADTGARCGIRLLPDLQQCHTTCDCSSRAAVCKHGAAALLQAARCLDTMPLALLTLRGRSARDVFAGIKDPDHPSLHPRYRPAGSSRPPTISAETAYDRWQHSPRPPLPPLPLPPEHPAAQGPPGMPGADAAVLAGVAEATSGYAHALLRRLTGTTLPMPVPAQTAAEPTTPLTTETSTASPAASGSPAGLPLQQRLELLRESLGLTREELVRAVTDWDSQ
ncbi:hypothetical protein [Streptomyces sp. NPDC058861]|uniref:hypothetical protein n=1 Tax=Streptomyces sp. NPDC058861 TaxID=3346653 RepID=UPI00367C892B